MSDQDGNLAAMILGDDDGLKFLKTMEEEVGQMEEVGQQEEEEEGKIALVMGMGFGRDRARMALLGFDWDVQRAVNSMLG